MTFQDNTRCIHTVKEYIQIGIPHSHIRIGIPPNSNDLYASYATPIGFSAATVVPPSMANFHKLGRPNMHIRST